MSKRHYHTPASGHDHTIPSDIPFRSDLVFYAPMTEQCCCDYVSNCVPITDTNGGSTTNFASCVWDSAADMWKLRIQQSNTNITQYLAALRWMSCQLYSGVGNDNIIDKGITLFFQTKMVSNSSASWNPIYMVDEFKTCSPNADGQGGGEDVTTTRLMIRQTDIGAFTTLSKVALTWHNGTATWYKNGSQVKRQSTWTVHVFVNPTTVSLLQIIRGTSYEEIYAKDVRVYNRALSQTEVQQL